MRNKLSVTLLCLALTLVPSPTGIRDPEMAQFPEGATPEPMHSEAPVAEAAHPTAEGDQPDDEAQVPVVVLDVSLLSLDTNGNTEAFLNASVSPEAPEGVVYHWSSSDPDVAMVSDTGDEATITGLHGGASMITVQVSGDALPEVLIASCEVAVDEPLTSLSLSSDALILNAGEEAGATGKLTILPQPLSHTETIDWTVQQEGVVVTFDPSRGILRAQNPGTALIVATASSGLSAQCKVLVRETRSTEALSQTGMFSENTTPRHVPSGAPAVLRAETSVPDEADEGEEANETPVALGELLTFVTNLEKRPWERMMARRPAVAGATDEEPKKVEDPTSAVNAPAPEQYVRFANDGTALGLSIKGEPIALQAGVFDAHGTLLDAPLSWSSSDNKVARVDDDGEVRPIKVGKAIITAAAPSGASATCAVTVYKTAAQSIKLFTEAPVRLERGGQLRPNVGYSPMHSYAPLKWSSSDERVVRIDPLSGLMTAVGKGEATVTAASPDLPETALSLAVQVSAPITAIAMYKDALRDDSSWQANPGETRMLYVEIEPDWDVTGDSVVWSSSAPKVASVDKHTGKVTAHKSGKAIITAKADSGAKATCTVMVK